ncbi:hypothetical protein K435DRAFT_744783 [Dendrothele bispora CBS 962.96]|uniref:DNA polymerase delta subunit 3 n=1 Tax=Dendrothele bispora (strain CBS 962.96) TaxID=1314807 RepID=A0A4S8MT52_DENBC|nr:hypothetical protein K435DRAFT_744783 [Dendrothele bispora CBS 962.96]
MSSKVVEDFLTKQLLIEKNIVTFRSLSRQLSLHVNVAKNELANFYRKYASQERPEVAATFLLSGQFASRLRTSDDNMDVDVESYEGNDGETAVSEIKVIIVGENEIEGARTRCLKLNTVHIYSLSPSHIHDAGLLCDPTNTIRDIDGKKPEMVQISGKIISANIKSKAIKAKPALPPVAGPSKVKTNESKDSMKETPALPKKEDSLNSTSKPKPKATGKLDFSKAKTKAQKEKEKEQVKEESDQDKKEETQTKEKKMAEKREGFFKSKEKDSTKGATTTSSKPEEKETQKEKKNLKRKSHAVMLSESEEEASSKATSGGRSNVRVKKRAVLSDEEEDIPAVKSRKSAGKIKIEEADSELHAMMNVDDDKVERVSRDKQAEGEEEETVETEENDVNDEDVEMKDVAPVQKKKRKTKKEVPRGRNGLKKRRVVRSRMTTDAKGYMVTEDYSEYESVDEEEEPAPTKAKGKSKKETNNDGNSASTSKTTKPKVGSEKKTTKKTDESSKNGQRGISAFLTKPSRRENDNS